MFKNTFFPACLALFFYAQNGDAQQTFHAGLILGLTAAQLDGDEVAGFNQPGLQGGGRVAINLKERQQLSLEMLFSQRGARHNPPANSNSGSFNLRTNYIDIPVQWHYNDWLVEADGGESYYKIGVNLGLYYGRLLGFKSKCSDSPTNCPLEIPLKVANKSDLGWMAGATFYANEHLGFAFRYCRSINRLYNPNKHRNAQGVAIYGKPLESYFLNLQAIYMF